MYLITVYGITGHQIFELTIAADGFYRLANKMIHTTQEHKIGDNAELMREVCRLLNRNAIELELNPEYEPLIKKRSMSHTPPLASHFGGGHD